MIQALSCVVTFAGVPLPYVFAATGTAGWDAAYPTCTVTVPVKPATGNEGDEMTVMANGILYATTRVVEFRPTSDAPPTLDIVGVGSLARAEEVAPLSYYNDPLDAVPLFQDVANPSEPYILPTGTTSTGKNIILAILARVASIYPEVVYDAADFDDAGVELGLEADDPFTWNIGQTALDYIREIDRLEGYRTFQSTDGTIYRRKIVGTPRDTLDCTFNAHNTLRGATGDRDTKQTRNWMRVDGFDWGKGHGPSTYTHQDFNDLQAIDEPHVATFSHQGIEREDETTDPGTGYSAQQVAEREIENVNKEFVSDTVSTPLDAIDDGVTPFGPGQTHLVDLLDHIRVGEPMWAQTVTWRMDTSSGWTVTVNHTGGGTQQAYTPLPV